MSACIHVCCIYIRVNAKAVLFLILYWELYLYSLYALEFVTECNKLKTIVWRYINKIIGKKYQDRNTVTEHCFWVVNSPAPYSGGPRFKSGTEDRLSWQVSGVFSVLPGKCRDSTLRQVTTVPCTYFPVHHSIITFAFKATYSDLLKMRSIINYK
jgi:hypothetical protein